MTHLKNFDDLIGDCDRKAKTSPDERVFQKIDEPGKGSIFDSSVPTEFLTFSIEHVFKSLNDSSSPVDFKTRYEDKLKSLLDIKGFPTLHPVKVEALELIKETTKTHLDIIKNHTTSRKLKQCCIFANKVLEGQYTKALGEKLQEEELAQKASEVATLKAKEIAEKTTRVSKRHLGLPPEQSLSLKRKPEDDLTHVDSSSRISSSLTEIDSLDKITNSSTPRLTRASSAPNLFAAVFAGARRYSETHNQSDSLNAVTRNLEPQSRPRSLSAPTILQAHSVFLSNLNSKNEVKSK